MLLGAGGLGDPRWDKGEGEQGRRQRDTQTAPVTVCRGAYESKEAKAQDKASFVTTDSSLPPKALCGWRR